MAKNDINIKEPIALRQKKLKGGRISLYLDYYVGGVDRNRAHEYEFLKLYLIPETSREAKVKNAETLKAALTIKNKRLIERASGKAGLPSGKGNISICSWIDSIVQKKNSDCVGKSRCNSYKNLREHIERFLKGKTVLLSSVNKSFVVSFVRYLSTAERLRKGKGKPALKLSKTTARSYLCMLSSCLADAVRNDLIPANPCAGLSKNDTKPLAGNGRTIHYLTSEQIKAFIDTPCSYAAVKHAFLFSCFTGLRISDVEELRWSMIRETDDGLAISKIIKKTRSHLSIPLGKSAMRWLPARDNASPSDRVFSLPTRNDVAYHLNIIGKKMQLPFRLHYHVSRHTFATSLITQGVDIYTVSKLMGHKNVLVTQVYAELINEKKKKAISMLDSFV